MTISEMWTVVLLDQSWLNLVFLFEHRLQGVAVLGMFVSRKVEFSEY